MSTPNPPPDPAKPPFTLLSSPVYALATSSPVYSRNPSGTQKTLNLVTYASPISIVPRFYALGLYRGTLSAENMLATGEGVLQILGVQHAPLFSILGKTSGRNVDKHAEIVKSGFSLTEFCGQVILADCLGAMKLKIVTDECYKAPFVAGDHDVVICSVEEFETFHADMEPLYTGYLKKHGYM